VEDLGTSASDSGGNATWSIHDLGLSSWAEALSITFGLSWKTDSTDSCSSSDSHSSSSALTAVISAWGGTHTSWLWCTSLLSTIWNSTTWASLTSSGGWYARSQSLHRNPWSWPLNGRLWSQSQPRWYGSRPCLQWLPWVLEPNHQKMWEMPKWYCSRWY
jgi:hypothetical protein